jgi:hypothetical protein
MTSAYWFTPYRHRWSPALLSWDDSQCLILTVTISSNPCAGRHMIVQYEIRIIMVQISNPSLQEIWAFIQINAYQHNSTYHQLTICT